MISARLPWRHRARPSATLHEIQVRSSIQRRTNCPDDATKCNSPASRANCSPQGLRRMWAVWGGRETMLPRSPASRKSHKWFYGARAGWGKTLRTGYLAVFRWGLAAGCSWPVRPSTSPGWVNHFKMPGVDPTTPVEKISQYFLRQRLPSSQFGLGIGVRLSF